MKITNFSVKNFRSISTAYKLVLGDYSVIVGPNNEGKSNILRSMFLGLDFFKKAQVLTKTYPNSQITVFGTTSVSEYKWELDSPLYLQSEKTLQSELTFEFEFMDSEIAEFKAITNISINKSLRIKLSFGQKKWAIDFLKSGKGKKNLSAKNKDVINFIADKLVIQYIPSIRTPELSSKIVSSLLEKEFEILSAKPEFRLLQEKLDKILKNVFTKISSSVTPMVSSFIPDVKKVTIQNARGLPSLLSASSIIKVDDGTETQLKAKGDGIISLTAISLLKHISEESKGEKTIILLIEEPESHLHPHAIHSLKYLLSDLNKNQQVILTTHSPIMINRVDVKRNIIVQNKKATSAQKIDEIRNSLGIHISDNLTTAYLILLVEGTKDVRLLHSWLTTKSSLIEASIRNGNLKIESLEGVANLSYKASFYKNILCNIHVFADDDDEARRAVKLALEKKIIKSDEYNVCTCLGMPNCEIEDAVKFECYNTEILKEHGVTLQKGSMSRGNKVWSDKIKIIFEHSGKIWGAGLENELKDLVANAAIKSSPTSLDNLKCKSIDGLIEAVEFKLKRNSK